MSNHIQINITDHFFNNADELENTLHAVGERVTSGQYKSGQISQIVENGRVVGECRVYSSQMTFVQSLRAGHDKNGNRREIVLQYDIYGDVIAVYKYNNTFPSALRVSSCISLPEVEISFKDYQARIKEAKESNHIRYFEGE